jgi:septum formation protein
MNKLIHSPLILASQSQSRAQILSQIGLEFKGVPSGVDEDILKKQGQEMSWSMDRIALELARAKAKVVSDQHPDALVIGADQIMGCEGQAFDKAKDLTEAADQLGFISGKSHYLYTACVLFQDGQEVWSHVNIPALKVRSLSEEFIQDYVQKLGDDILRCVGCYQIEGRGAQLFESIDGDIFTIMGLPLFPLLQELRRLGMILT